MRSRLERFRRQAVGPEEGFLITGAANRRWLSGFTGSYGWLIVTAEDAVLLTDGRYAQQAEEEAPSFTLAVCRGGMAPALPGIVARLGVRRLAFEEDHLTYHQAKELEERLRPVVLTPSPDRVQRLRRVKDAGEIQRMERAQAVADAAMEELWPLIRPGVRETDLAHALAYRMGMLGAEGVSFPTIVASGARTALPHAQPTGKVLERGDFLTIDWGAVVEGYASDCTRTYAVGRLPEGGRDVYETVRRAKEAAIEAARPGAVAKDLDAVARRVIAEAGFPEDTFLHSLGHGVGLEVHEGPALGRNQDDILEEGMVLTFEPGVYLPGTGGVRIEDAALITSAGARILSRLSSTLQVL